MRKLRKIKFKEFIKLQRGFDLPKKDMVDGPYPVMGSTSIIGYHKEYKQKAPGVITGRSGSLGKLQYINKKYWPHNTSLWIKDFKGNFPKYVYYFLHSIDFKNFNAGVGVPTLNRNHLDNYDIETHEIDDQKKIATILSNYDDLIENNTKRIQLLEKIAKLIYDEWFVKFRFPGHENVKMAYNEDLKKEIPKGWEVKKLIDLGYANTGKTPSTKDKENYGTYMPFIRPPDMHNGMFCIQTTIKISKKGNETQKKKTLEANTLIVSCIGTVGLVNITSEQSQTNQQINALIIKDRNHLEYLYFKLKSLRLYLENLGACGATMTNVSKGKFESIKIIKPSDDLLEKYHKMISPIFCEIKNILIKNQNLQKTRDQLLPKLISGVVDVSDLDIRVPEVEA